MQRFVVKLSKVTTDKKSCDLASGNIQQTFFFIVSGHYYVFKANQFEFESISRPPTEQLFVNQESNTSFSSEML